MLAEVFSFIMPSKKYQSIKKPKENVSGPVPSVINIRVGKTGFLLATHDLTGKIHM